MAQADVDRVQEFRKCIECFLCQDVCHVLRDHQKHDEFIGPRFLVYVAALEMHPLDTEDRLAELKDAHGIGYCNITKCCTKVCPEHITITDNAIIPLKERVVDRFYDPITRLFRMFGGELMFELKQLSTSAIPAALAQAERYRLLNEPVEAESICLDVLRVDPDNQEALVTLVLALTDQFPHGPVARAMAAAEEALLGLRDDYKRLYYSGIIRERRGKAQLHSDRPGSHRAVHEWLREAMAYYEQAEAIRPAGNDEAILRWNTCARILNDLPVSEPDIPEFHSVQSE